MMWKFFSRMLNFFHNVKIFFHNVIIFVHDVEIFFSGCENVLSWCGNIFQDVEIWDRYDRQLRVPPLQLPHRDVGVRWWRLCCRYFFHPIFFWFLVVVWGFRSRKRKMWLSENFRSKWLLLKCVLKAIDRGQEAIEWTGFFGSRSIRDPFSRCEIHFVNSVLQLSPFSQQLALYSQRTPLLADSQCIHYLFLIWISFAKDCQLVTLTHSHSLFLLLHQWKVTWVTENIKPNNCLNKKQVL